jgi:molecular chaperone GrpE
MTGDQSDRSREQLAEEVERLQRDLHEQTSRAEDCLTRVRYLQADFDNYRKQFDRQKASIIEHANENLIHDLLVILDDLDQALPSLENEKNREGMAMVNKKLRKILAQYGLEPIECVGKKFDPCFHEVVCKEDSDSAPDTVLEDLEKGYRLKSKVIRPSKVKVAGHAAGDEGEKNG